MRPEYYCYPKLNLNIRLTGPLDPRLVQIGCPAGLAHKLAVEAGYVADTAGLPWPCPPAANALPIDPRPLILLLS